MKLHIHLLKNHTYFFTDKVSNKSVFLAKCRCGKSFMVYTLFPVTSFKVESKRVYVAGKYSSRKKIRLIYEDLKGLGYSITLDWTRHDLKSLESREEQLCEFAMDDINGVREADFVVAYMIPRHRYTGLWVEVGVALALNKPVYIVGNGGDSCVFSNHPSVKKFVNLGELYKFLKESNDKPNIFHV